MLIRPIITAVVAFVSITAFGSETSENLTRGMACTEEFQPVSCQAEYSGITISASAENRCLTLAALTEQINSDYHWFVPVEAHDLTNITCTLLTTLETQSH